ncbi:MAG: MBL fold metallo-hydrolase [Deltaproteobacteria bacterium]|nr:MBL fold metallo-hydrolase [Deltaproteobacteria bacterium]
MKRFGRFQLAEIQTGWQRLDGGAMFGVVPKALWNKLIPADDRNRIPLALRALYIDTGDRKVVVDTGIGEKFDDKQKDIYGAESFPGGLRGTMQKLGLDYRAVTDCILTHLHFDHAGGATTLGANGYEPTFPNADYYLQRRALEWAENPTEKDRVSFRPDDWQSLIASGRLQLLDGPTEVLPGVSIVISDGHAVAQQLVLVDGGEGHKLLYCGDVIPTSAHIPLPYVMAYDLHPLKTLEEKRVLLAQALEDDWILYFEHDPKIAAAKITEENGKFRCGAVVSI